MGGYCREVTAQSKSQGRLLLLQTTRWTDTRGQREVKRKGGDGYGVSE